MKVRLYAADHGQPTVGGRIMEVRQLCQTGNGACGATAERVLLIDSPIERPNGSVVFVCTRCADHTAFGLLEFAQSIMSVSLEEWEAMKEALAR